MIQEFRVKNFMSIKDEQVLSFEATKDTTSLEYLTYEVKPNVRLLKMAILYGANASGKTNIIGAMHSLWRLLFEAKNSKTETIKQYHPFALTTDYPTEFSIVFYIGTIKYEYSVIYNEKNIVAEEMKYAPNGITSLFYRREYTGQDKVPAVRFGDLLELSAKTKNTLTENTLNNHTLLSTYGKISVEADALKEVYNWGENIVITFFYNSNHVQIIEKILSDNSRMNFVFNALHKADFNISKIEIKDFENNLTPEKRKEIENDSSMQPLTKLMLLVAKERDALFTHHTKKGDFTLRTSMESDGTKAYFKFLNDLYNMTIQNRIYIYDEIEKNMHYDLLIHYLSLFMMNTKASQMIFTTHDQMLLDEDFIRRDIVWFTEKSNDTGATELYSAAEFGLHKNLSLYKAYKAGRLGAKPNLGSIFIEQ